MSIAALLLFIRRLGLTLPLWLVAGWSAAEAALFFVVADVPISWIAVRRGPKAGLLAALVAAVASVVSAAIVWWWTPHDPAGIAATYAALPAIDPALIAEAADRYHKGPHAVLAGSFSGIPFKLFAMEAAKRGDLFFLLLAPLLRLPRFAAVALVSGGLSDGLARWMSERQRLTLLILLWVAFYALYWSAMSH